MEYTPNLDALEYLSFKDYYDGSFNDLPGSITLSWDDDYWHEAMLHAHSMYLNSVYRIKNLSSIYDCSRIERNCTRLGEMLWYDEPPQVSSCGKFMYRPVGEFWLRYKPVRPVDVLNPLSKSKERSILKHEPDNSYVFFINGVAIDEFPCNEVILADLVLECAIPFMILEPDLLSEYDLNYVV